MQKCNDLEKIMNDSEFEKLSELARQLTSMTFVLNGYCENFDGNGIEISNLIEFTKILYKTSNKLFDLL